MNKKMWASSLVSLTLAAGTVLTTASQASAASSVIYNSSYGCIGTIKRYDAMKTGVLWGCNANADQRWTRNVELNVEGYEVFTMKNALNECLGTWGGRTELNTEVAAWSCNGNDDQKWFTYQPAGKTTVNICNWKAELEGSRRCIGTRNGSVANGTDLIIWHQNSNADQQWWV
ncbi:hypothetical protein Snoj_28990 [Streptomyces nojiriensis]|uniref:Ricin B lectin domain-containing protein n=1 Tax=Streptomyces nojiriensis TaxID=66374 RepID=A0ABQ3SLG5_9ACTN|nr:ricin-type beta-trefoil lectin domain protein [Streptomyces nojiriensis]QTI42575.1 hypothetical protein JYK04_00333 [Streptomyces nojiriensis]GGS37714.1 hypothetical protein GCM10010205_79490 [Streptomyces nojiriensis]GHI68981.1 hypothetical protein Snoj_28990 [Streptomyces nojiriensis]